VTDLIIVLIKEQKGYISTSTILGDNGNHSEEEEEVVELHSTGPQSSSTQPTSSGVVLDEDRKDNNRQEDIPVVEPVSEQGDGQMFENDLIEALPVSCTSPADVYLTTEYFIKDTVPDPPIFLFPPILAGPGETVQVKTDFTECIDEHHILYRSIHVILQWLIMDYCLMMKMTRCVVQY